MGVVGSLRCWHFGVEHDLSNELPANQINEPRTGIAEKPGFWAFPWDGIEFFALILTADAPAI